MVKLKITSHCNEDTDLSANEVLNVVREFCVNENNMKWVENTDYPKVFDGQSIKLVFIVDGEYDFVQDKLLKEFRSGKNALFHRFKIEMT